SMLPGSSLIRETNVDSAGKASSGAPIRHGVPFRFSPRDDHTPAGSGHCPCRRLCPGWNPLCAASVIHIGEARKSPNWLYALFLETGVTTGNNLVGLAPMPACSC